MSLVKRGGWRKTKEKMRDEVMKIRKLPKVRVDGQLILPFMFNVQRGILFINFYELNIIRNNANMNQIFFSRGFNHPAQLGNSSHLITPISGKLTSSNQHAAFNKVYRVFLICSN